MVLAGGGNASVQIDDALQVKGRRPPRHLGRDGFAAWPLLRGAIRRGRSGSAWPGPAFYLVDEEC